jgi:23S rRNA pseudouridine1911/1915/1917 synthase
VRFVLEAGHERERVDKAVARLLAPTSRATIQRWITEGRVQVQGRVCRPRDVVSAGAVIDVEPGPELTSSAEPDPNVPFEVVFEDAHLLVVDKPAGVVVHPARGHRRGTLVSGLLSRPGFSVAPVDERDPEGKLRPGIVHRIDKDTSGLLVVAKDALTREGLKLQLMEHSVSRVYRALSVGVPSAGRIESAYGRHPRSRLRFTSRVEVGKRAVTDVAVLEVLCGGAAALVECRLKTGRTHQIRVHLSERAGAPLLADALYGTPSAEPSLRQIGEELGRHALHAMTLGFVHPVTAERLQFTSAFPPDLARALEALRSLGPLWDPRHSRR